MKKRLALILASAMLVSSALCGLTSCKAGGNKDNVDSSKGHVYYLNFKPEQDAQWQALAEAYTEETGVQVDVLTAADGTYETTLASEMAKSDAPTLFQVNGPVGLANWKDYCYDMSSSAVYKELTSESYALKEGSAVYGVAYVVETYGIIVNTKLLGDAGYKVEDIKDFASLKAIAEDITAKKATLGFSAFTSAGMDGSSDWRFKTHLANLPIYYEYKADGIGTTDAIKGTYLDNYRAIWDLYINNATCEPGILSTKTGDDAVAEFKSGQAVFYQNGTWAYGDIAEVGDENLKMIPIYIGADGEENQGLCSGSENYWCVNKTAAQEDIDATLDFLEWVVTSDKGTTALAEEMKFVSPFKKAKESTNLFVKQDAEYTAAGKTPVDWCFATMPSEEWKNGVGSALTAYASDPSDATWESVKTAFVDGWASEVEKTKK
ncbi:MAG: ABC transporter substrate-binding protein [Acutalibacteraceae bacterium]